MPPDNERIVATYEDARSLANIAVWSVELQIHRLKAEETEIPDFVMQPVVDFHFLVIALTRLRKAAELAAKTTDISAALKEFDETLPDLKKIRNVLEHIDEYRLGEGRNKNVKANELQTVILNHDQIFWSGYEINPVKALQASDRLFNAIKNSPPDAYLEKVK